MTTTRLENLVRPGRPLGHRARASLPVEIRDNGRGGATLANGSGIRGLADRVEVELLCES